MRVTVKVRLFTAAGEEVVEGILSNEEAGEKYGCELLVDGARWTGVTTSSAWSMAAAWSRDGLPGYFPAPPPRGGLSKKELAEGKPRK